MRDRSQSFYQGIDSRQHDLRASIPEHQGVSKIVDVLGGAGEMHETGDAGYLAIVRQLFLEPILDRFDIVIGAGLDLLYRVAVDLLEVAHHRVQLFYRRRRQGRNAVERFGGAERLQPFDFDQNAVTDQAEFAEVIREPGNFVPVAAIERGQGGERGKWHHPTG